MKKSLIFGIAFLWLTGSVWAAPYVFSYILKPGNQWTATVTSQTEIRSQDQKELIRSKTLIEYRVLQGIDPAWFMVAARVRSRTDYTGRSPQTDVNLYQTLFQADMHVSGDLRNVAYQMGTSSLHPPAFSRTAPGLSTQETGPFYDFMEQWQEMVFWFPVFPNTELKPGHSFEITQKRFMTDSDNQWQTRGLVKQILTLESVQNGLAVFSVQDRSAGITDAGFGSNTGTRSLTKAQAVFDLRQGMWVEWTSKYRGQERINPGKSGSAVVREIMNITKYEIRKQ
ncbi:MAG: hypothetical protein EHM45_01000 [Desulfobacteraceae bacterium]|nr:MAG: hypothetical protein EHM45_01000 [Desulfobacteraceae bacterium]